MQKRVQQTQHVTSHNVGRCWPTMLRPLARGFMNLLNARTKDKQARDYKLHVGESHKEGMSVSYDR